MKLLYNQEDRKIIREYPNSFFAVNYRLNYELNKLFKMYIRLLKIDKLLSIITRNIS